MKWNISANLRKDSYHTSYCVCFHLILITEWSTSDFTNSHEEVPVCPPINVQEAERWGQSRLGPSRPSDFCLPGACLLLSGQGHPWMPVAGFGRTAHTPLNDKKVGSYIFGKTMCSRRGIPLLCCATLEQHTMLLSWQWAEGRIPGHIPKWLNLHCTVA